MKFKKSNALPILLSSAVTLSPGAMAKQSKDPVQDLDLSALSNSDKNERINEVFEKCRVSAKKTSDCNEEEIVSSSKCMTHAKVVAGQARTYRIFCAKVIEYDNWKSSSEETPKKQLSIVINELNLTLHRYLKSSGKYDFMELVQDPDKFNDFTSLLILLSGEISDSNKTEIIKKMEIESASFLFDLENPKISDLFEKDSGRYTSLEINTPWSFLPDALDRAVAPLNNIKKILVILGENVADLDKNITDLSEKFLSKSVTIFLKHSEEKMKDFLFYTKEGSIKRFQDNSDLYEIMYAMNFLDAMYGETTNDEKQRINDFRNKYESYLLENYRKQIQAFRTVESDILSHPFYLTLARELDPFLILKANRHWIENYKNGSYLNINRISEEIETRSKDGEYNEIIKTASGFDGNEKEIKLLQKLIKKALKTVEEKDIKSLLMAMKRQIENHTRLSSIDLESEDNLLLDVTFEQAKKEVYSFVYPSSEIVENNGNPFVLVRKFENGTVVESNELLGGIREFSPERLLSAPAISALRGLKSLIPNKNHPKYSKIINEIQKFERGIAQRLAINVSNSLIYLSEYNGDCFSPWILDHNSLGRSGWSRVVPQLNKDKNWSGLDPHELMNLANRDESYGGGPIAEIDRVLFDYSYFIYIHKREVPRSKNDKINMKNPGRNELHIFNKKRIGIIEGKISEILDKYEQRTDGKITSDIVSILRAAGYMDVDTKKLIKRFLLIEKVREGDNFNKKKLLEEINSNRWLL